MDLSAYLALESQLQLEIAKCIFVYFCYAVIFLFLVKLI